MLPVARSRFVASLALLVPALTFAAPACNAVKRAEECGRVVDLINKEATVLTQTAQMDANTSGEDAQKIEAFEHKIDALGVSDAELKKIVEDYRSMLREFAVLVRDAGKPDARAPELAKRSDALQKREDEIVERLHAYCNK